MRKWWVNLAVLVALGLFISLWTKTDVLSAADEQPQVAQAGKKADEKASEKANQAKSDIIGIHKQLEKVKTDLAKDKKYACCIKPSCDFCALTMVMCPCGMNLSKDKPVCPECLAGWKAGQGVFKKVDAKKVNMAPAAMLKKMMEMKAKLIGAIKKALLEKASLEKVSLKVAGMSCDACKTGVQAALQNISGVKGVEVSLQTGETIVKHEKGKVTIAQLVKAIEEKGFQASVKK